MTLPSSRKFSRIPSVDVLLRDAEFAGLLDSFGQPALVQAIRGVLADLRVCIDEKGSADTDPASIAAKVGDALGSFIAPSLKPVFNLTGTILHTNLGRAPLPDVAVKAMINAAGAVNLEYDLGTGGRGQRDSHVENLITRLTGAEAAIVVNNNAAAVLIALNTLALDQEALVSRGELIEIGGAFRLPDIMQRAGCRLREVGTTNRTHKADYQAAIGPDTNLILKAHTSNYQVQGFTKAVPEPELAELAQAHDIPFIVDLGSGTLVELERFGLPYEATVRETLENGADLVTFSGDKLLGGPQAGIIAGRADLIERIAKNPMKRAMRLDKVTLAALGAVLRLYTNPDKLIKALPTLSLLTRDLADIQAQAKRLKPRVADALQHIATVDTEPCQSQIGSGSLPVDLLESHAISLRARNGEDSTLRDIGCALRALPKPVIGRFRNGSIILDLRCLTDEDAFLHQLAGLAI